MKSKTRRLAELGSRIQQDRYGNITSIKSKGLTTETADFTSSLNGVDGTFSGNVDVQGSFGSVQDLTGTGSVVAQSFVTTVIHNGTGTITVPTDGFAKGSQISIVTNGTINNINWGDSSKGISLGSATKMASGTFDGVKWFYSEAATN
jgi:hypothetical protein